MKSITAQFDELDKLSPAELRGSIVAFREIRDRYTKEGRVGDADIYATLLGALCEERDRRAKAWGKAREALTSDPGVETEASWWEAD